MKEGVFCHMCVCVPYVFEYRCHCGCVCVCVCAILMCGHLIGSLTHYLQYLKKTSLPL